MSLITLVLRPQSAAAAWAGDDDPISLEPLADLGQPSQPHAPLPLSLPAVGHRTSLFPTYTMALDRTPASCLGSTVSSRRPSLSMQQAWTFLQHSGPNHLDRGSRYPAFNLPAGAPGPTAPPPQWFDPKTLAAFLVSTGACCFLRRTSSHSISAFGDTTITGRTPRPHATEQRYQSRL